MHDAVLSYLYDQWCQTVEGRSYTAISERGAFEHKVEAFRRWLRWLQAGKAPTLAGFVAEYRRQERLASEGCPDMVIRIVSEPKR